MVTVRVGGPPVRLSVGLLVFSLFYANCNPFLSHLLGAAAQVIPFYPTPTAEQIFGVRTSIVANSNSSAAAGKVNIVLSWGVLVNTSLSSPCENGTYAEVIDSVSLDVENATAFYRNCGYGSLTLPKEGWHHGTFSRALLVDMEPGRLYRISVRGFSRAADVEFNYTCPDVFGNASSSRFFVVAGGNKFQDEGAKVLAPLTNTYPDTPVFPFNSLFGLLDEWDFGVFPVRLAPVFSSLFFFFFFFFFFSLRALTQVFVACLPVLSGGLLWA
jgi:hypothetical protein